MRSCFRLFGRMAIVAAVLGSAAAGEAAAAEVASIGTQIVPIWRDGSPNNPANGPRPVIEIFRPFVAADSLPATIVILPGGGYGSHSPYERLYAEHFRALGYTAAVVRFRVAPHRYPAPYADATRAIRLLRVKAQELNVPSQNLAVMGGSAGGHLAALIATRPALYLDPDDDLADRVSARPDRLILAYPVISAVSEYAAKLSFSRLIGDDASVGLRRELSPELHVTGATPPAFIFHAADDRQVPAENSIAFARACWAAGVPAELHVFPRGGHGRLFAYAADVSPRWRELLGDWLAGWLSSTKPPAG